MKKQENTLLKTENESSDKILKYFQILLYCIGQKFGKRKVWQKCKLAK